MNNYKKLKGDDFMWGGMVFRCESEDASYFVAKVSDYIYIRLYNQVGYWNADLVRKTARFNIHDECAETPAQACARSRSVALKALVKNAEKELRTIQKTKSALKTYLRRVMLNG